MAKLTIHDLFEAKKSGRTFLEIRTSDLREAIACAEAGVEIIMCMKEDLPVIRPAVPDVFIIAAHNVNLPAVCGPDQAVGAAFELMNMGADAVYSAMSTWVVEVMARESIPVVGHIGYVPYRSTWYGKRAVGKTAIEARKVYEHAKAYQDAGAIGVEIEIVPAKVAAEINRRLDKLILMSMGSGTGATVQYLFATDILGTNTGHIPRHAKVYAKLAEEETRIQRLRIEAFKALRADMRSGAYPEEKHVIGMQDEEFDAFVKSLD